MKKSIRVWLTTLALCCLSCDRLIKPAEVELVGMAFPGESIVDLNVKIKNPNSFSAKASNIEYTVSVGSNVIGHGRTGEVLIIGARDSLVTRLPMSYNAVALLRALPQLTQDTTVCRVEGTYRLEALMLRPQVRFSAGQRVALKEALRKLVSAARVSDI